MSIGQVVSLALTGSAPLLLVVMGMVQWLKRLNLSGVVLNIASLLTGLLFGGVYLYATLHPIDLLGFFFVIVYGLVIGLIASGIYDLAGNIAAKAK